MNLQVTLNPRFLECKEAEANEATEAADAAVQ